MSPYRAFGLAFGRLGETVSAGWAGTTLARQSKSGGLIGQVGVGEVRRKRLLPAGASPAGPTAITAIVQLAHDLDRGQDAHQRVEVEQDLASLVGDDNVV